jgi:hypothetical protein
MATNVKILLRRGLRSEISADTLSAGELGYAEDTRQLYVGIESNSSIPVDEIIFDPFAHAQSIVQTYLNLPVVSGGPTEQGREIDEDLIIRNVSNVSVLLNDMATYGVITAGAFEPTVSVPAGSFVSVSDPAGLFLIGREYIIEVSGTTDFTFAGAADSNVGTTFTAIGNGTETYSAGSFVIGIEYTILTVNDGIGGAGTDFTLIGATDSNIGTEFTATGVGTGTGTANFVGTGRATYGTSYTIATVDDGVGGATTDFTLIGAADNNIGTVFKATGIGTGTGTATYGKEYKIKTTGTTDYTAIGSSVLTSGNFVVGTQYTILVPGDTDFTLIGAIDSNVDTTFVATGVGIGTGTALKTTFIATGVGTGTGTAIDTSDHFYANLFASERKNVEVLTENSFSQVYANMHLQSHTSTDGRRPDLFKKDLATTSGTFLKYAKTDSTSFFIDYSLKQVGTSPAITFVRVGRLQVINGAAITPEIAQAKLTDTNTEIWQDDGDSIAQSDEFSNIVFTAVIDGDSLKINYTQEPDFTTEISYTVKRWTM